MYSDLPPREIFDPERFGKLQEAYIAQYWQELFESINLEEAGKMELKVPEEIREIFDEGLAAEVCRDKCLNSLFKAKRAIYYAKSTIGQKESNEH